MWIATTTGFYSAVQHNTNPDLLVVRVRVKGDLDALHVYAVSQPEAYTYDGPIQYAHSDYPWRAIVDKITWAGFLAESAQAIDYGNFKAAVEERQGLPREVIYSGVWSVLTRLESLDPARRLPVWPVDMDDLGPDVGVEFCEDCGDPIEACMCWIPRRPDTLHKGWCALDTDHDGECCPF